MLKNNENTPRTSSTMCAPAKFVCKWAESAEKQTTKKRSDDSMGHDQELIGPEGFHKEFTHWNWGKFKSVTES